MLKQLLLGTASLVAPRFTARTQQMRWHIQHARDLRDQCRRSATLEQMVDLVLRSELFPSLQKRAEVLGLLRLLQEHPPRCLCEIGAFGGGTLMLFCAVAAPKARILSIDLAFSDKQMRILPQFASHGQRLTCLKADTHLPQTHAQVEYWLAGGRLDFLFIDGDHSLAGVKQDHEMYAPLVRPGGLIGFHDILPDSRTRFGTVTQADSGQVPEYWNIVKQNHSQVREFIENPDQDGLGIGILQVT
jgi:predicted O-methyltransferase YrrM